MSSLRNQKGFTLVEIAIVLVIIGLILGATLKGQELINNAKVKSAINQYKSITAAVYTYQDKYGQLPGDDIRATSRAWAGSCTGLANGNGDGYLYEYFQAPLHLACSGLITGSYNGTSDYITSPWGTRMIIYRDNISGKTGNGVRFYNLTAEDAESLDRALDDGIYNTGTCRGNAAFTAGTTIGSFTCFF